MKRMLLALISAAPMFFTACNSGSDSAADAKPITPGAYRAFFSVKYYEDDTSPRSFMDVQTLNEDGTSDGRLYVIMGKDTAVLCIGDSDYEQKGNALVFSNNYQNCKDPDDLAGGYVDENESAEAMSRPIRDVTDMSFEMQGESIDKKKFWVKYSFF